MDVKELILGVVDDWNKRDKEAFLTNFTESSELTGPGGLALRGLAGAEIFWNLWQIAFPDNQNITENIFAAGDQGCREATFTGTHTGVLQYLDGSQIPPTGRNVRVRFVECDTACDDKFVTLHFYFDQVELLTQLGLMPPPNA